LNIAPIQISGKESSIQESTPRSASIEGVRKAACPKDERAAAYIARMLLTTQYRPDKKSASLPETHN
jgi:hypothetical protein